MILGIDEAGRGPVVGPLVIAGAVADKFGIKSLRGLRDSKKYTRRRREQLYQDLIKLKHEIIIVKPAEIDKALASDNTNLNWLEADKNIEIINKLKPKRAIIDCPSTNIKAFKEYLSKKVKVDLIVEHKADENHEIVAAASILAKVTRDRIISDIEKKIKKRIGSGYPSDPVTRQFLKENFRSYPEIFRKSWDTYKKLSQTKLDCF